MNLIKTALVGFLLAALLASLLPAQQPPPPRGMATATGRLQQPMPEQQQNGAGQQRLGNCALGHRLIAVQLP